MDIVENDQLENNQTTYFYFKTSTIHETSSDSDTFSHHSTSIMNMSTDAYLSTNEREELTISALLSLSSTSSKRCRYKMCQHDATKRSPFCQQHLGSRSCEVINCKKYAQGGTQFCISHGGGHRCTYPGCSKGARGKFFCALHGGGKRCLVTDCPKLAVGGSNRCASHGGGKKCTFTGCTKAAQSPTHFCVRHGGGRKCHIEGCVKVSRGKTGFCASHGHVRNQVSYYSTITPTVASTLNNLMIETNNGIDSMTAENLTISHLNPVFCHDVKDSIPLHRPDSNTPPLLYICLPISSSPPVCPSPELINSNSNINLMNSMNSRMYRNNLLLSSQNVNDDESSKKLSSSSSTSSIATNVMATMESIYRSNQFLSQHSS